MNRMVRPHPTRMRRPRRNGSGISPGRRRPGCGGIAEDGTRIPTRAASTGVHWPPNVRALSRPMRAMPPGRHRRDAPNPSASNRSVVRASVARPSAVNPSAVRHRVARRSGPTPLRAWTGMPLIGLPPTGLCPIRLHPMSMTPAGMYWVPIAVARPSSHANGWATNTTPRIPLQLLPPQPALPPQPLPSQNSRVQARPRVACRVASVPGAVVATRLARLGADVAAW